MWQTYAAIEASQFMSATNTMFSKKAKTDFGKNDFRIHAKQSLQEV